MSVAGVTIKCSRCDAQFVTGEDRDRHFVTCREQPTASLTMVEFSDDDFAKAGGIAKSLGYEQTAYTSTSALWGLFCLPENPDYAKPGQATAGGCIIKTRELGFLFVQDGEDLHLGYEFGKVEIRCAD